ncbi:thiamine pyrophosphokinase 1 [Hyphodiscus hymeniophilus]|uniref:Thiamine pyrophosphokinase n=1 Tax=Hyphodiscus hymeniophilus TaxID=353542 RepID=A0A9P6VE45_9HELO|nr:thiamine pyrophosphokinase 1 [Hyphodiscus hymeniophilus]
MAAILGTTIWHPADIFSDSPIACKDYGLVVLNQPLEDQVAFYTQVWNNAVYHVGADGGANCVYDLNRSNQEDKDVLKLDTVIGDLDSLRADAREYWLSRDSEIIYDPDQYSTDLTKAVKYIKAFEIPAGGEFTPSKDRKRAAALQKIKDGPRIKDIVCIGGLGGRVDQGMSTLHHLYIFQNESGYASGKMFLLSSEAITFVLKTGKHKIKVRETFPGMALGKNIGIIPLKEPSRITTKGLQWDVTEWLTAFGGQMSTSNYVKEDWVTVETTKDVLFTIDLNFASS